MLSHCACELCNLMRFCALHCREVLEAAMRGAGVAGSLSVMLRYDAATPLVETHAQASMAFLWL